MIRSLHSLRHLGLLGLFLFWPPTVAQDDPHSLGPGVFVRPLQPGVWLHVSRKPEGDPAAGTPANGLLVTTGEMSLLIDIGWTAEQTEVLLDWAEQGLGQPVEHVILTHAHEDRAGGIEALAGRSVILHGHAATAIMLERETGVKLDWTFEFQDRLDLGGESVELYYPRAGHSPDNVVVYLSDRRVLFAGCLVRSESDSGLGDTSDADLPGWPVAVRRVIERFRDVDILVAGHGLIGGVEQLSHTMELLESAGYTASDER